MKFLINKIELNESYQPIQPKRVLDEIDEIDNSLDDNITKEIIIPKDVLDSFKIKDTLNPQIWIEGVLNPKVKDKLLKIATDFYTDLELPSEVQIKDIIFTGSLANFNWSKFSDIDLHIIIDFKLIDGDPQMIQDFFREKKTTWSIDHDIKIFGYPVEMYIQDKHAKHISSAIYSILNDKWLIIPKHEKFKLDKDAVKRKAKLFVNQLRSIKKAYVNNDYKLVLKMATHLKHKIKQMRNAGLESGGEFSLENIVFKTLRRTPFMDQLDSFKNKAYDEIVSINENMKSLIKEKLNSLAEVKYIKQSNYVNTTDKTTYLDKKGPNISKEKMSPTIAAKKERKDIANNTPKQELSISDKEKQDVLDRQEKLAAKYANKKRG